MSQSNDLLLPSSREILAAYQYDGGKLRPCAANDHDPEHLPTAEATLAVWDAAHRLGDSTMMVLKSDQKSSIGILNGGLIIEGLRKLNVGIIRAATRSLDPVRMTTAATCYLDTEDRFRRALWAVMSRLHGATLSRTFQFELAGTSGTITIRDNQLTFAGDFKNPADFVGELRTACQIEENVQYTLGEPGATPAGDLFELSDLIKEVATVTAAECYMFDEEGWPTGCPDDVDFAMVQILSTMTRAMSSRDASKGDTSITVFSASSQPMLSGSVMPDGSARFELR